MQNLVSKFKLEKVQQFSKDEIKKNKIVESEFFKLKDEII
jgi:hypothetical protein